ncbi:MAG TPA: dihydrodipicolinate reductase [Myxococcales bacterium]|nr:dihydrodipicolinate reductase [Myxococcales bacterium]
MLNAVIPGAPEIAIHQSIEQLGDLSGIDCAIVTTRSRLPQCAPTLASLLGAGCSVVSTCEELIFPWLHHEKLARDLDELAKASNARLLGTGVNPGFLMDVFPIFATTVCKQVHAIQVHRIQDAGSRRAPFQKKIGATMTPKEFDQHAQSGAMAHVGLGESLHLIASHLNLPIQRWAETIQPVIAEEDLECAIGPISAGNVRGIMQVARGMYGAQCLVELIFKAAIAEPNPHDTIIVDGVPPFELTWRGGVHGDAATAALVLNTISPLLKAAPGLHMMTTITPPGAVRA